MHLADGTLPLAQAAVYGAVSGAVVSLGVWKYYKKSANKLEFKILSGAFAAFVFLSTVIEFPMPFGSSTHPAGTPLIGILMGPLITPFLSSVVLLLELLLKEGGITTLGANVLSLGVVGSLTGWGSFKVLRKLGVGLFIAGFLAGFLGDLCVYLTTAAQLAIGSLEGKSFLFYFVSFMPVQLPMALIEGVFTGLVLGFIFKRRSEMLVELGVID